MEQALSLVKKLAEIRKMSDVVKKDKKGYNYSYADITAILANVTAGMKKYGVSLIPSIVPGTSTVSQNVIETRKLDKTGKPIETKTTEMMYCAEMNFRWINDDNPEDIIDVPWYVTGSQTDPSQALGSGLTYCTRYFLTSYFQIAQPETDVDKYRSQQREAETAESRAIAESIIGEFDTILRKFLADNQDKVEEVKKFVSKYIKSGNYLLIKEPEIAAKLLDDFKENFLDVKGK